MSVRVPGAIEHPSRRTPRLLDVAAQEVQKRKTAAREAEQLQEQLSRTQAQLRASAASVAELQASNAQARSQLQQAREREQQQATAAGGEQQLQQLQQALAARDVEAERLRQQLEGLQAQLASTSEGQDGAMQLIVLKERVAALEAENDDLRTELNAFDPQVCWGAHRNGGSWGWGRGCGTLELQSEGLPHECQPDVHVYRQAAPTGRRSRAGAVFRGDRRHEARAPPADCQVPTDPAADARASDPQSSPKLSRIPNLSQGSNGAAPGVLLIDAPIRLALQVPAAGAGTHRAEAAAGPAGCGRLTDRSAAAARSRRAGSGMCEAAAACACRRRLRVRAAAASSRLGAVWCGTKGRGGRRGLPDATNL